MIPLMVYYEVKKVLSKKSSKLLLIIIVLSVAWSCHAAIYSVEWIDPSGNVELGYMAAGKLRAAQKEWAGTLDESLLHRALAEVKRLDNMPEYLSKNHTENRIAQGWRQGVQEIRQLLNLSFSNDFQNFDDRIAHTLSSDDLSDFYPNRIKLLRMWLYGNTNNFLTEREKQFLVDQYSTLATPFLIDYSQGWVQVMEHADTVMYLGIILLGLLLAGIFSDEFLWKTDAVYFSSAYGRSDGTKAKLITGFLLITVVFSLSMGIYSLVVLGSLGFDGAFCPIQINVRYWKSMYNMNFLQAYLLILCMGYVGYLFFGFLVMLVSAQNRSSMLAVMCPPLAILLPSFLQFILSNINSSLLLKMLGLLPEKMLNGAQVIRMLNIYSLGTRVLPSVFLLLPMYIGVSLMMVYMCYQWNRIK